MSKTQKCDRCDEQFKPVSLSKDWPRRLQGKITTLTHRITWTHIAFGNTPSLERPRITVTEVELCDGCWGDLLAWVNEPNQERLKIAARHRREDERVREVAEQRREREVQRLMRSEARA